MPKIVRRCYFLTGHVSHIARHYNSVIKVSKLDMDSNYDVVDCGDDLIKQACVYIIMHKKYTFLHRNKKKTNTAEGEEFSVVGGELFY